MPAVSNNNPSESWRWQSDPKAREVFALCRKLIGGELGVAEACRKMEDVLSSMWIGYSDWGHRDFEFVREVAQATQEFPVGSAREHWSAEALERKDHDLRPIEARFHERAIAEAQRILQYEHAA